MNYSKKWNLFHARSNLTPKTTTASLPHPQSIIPPLMRSVILKVTLSCPIFACLARDRWSLHPKETPNDACLAQTPAGTPPLVTGRLVRMHAVHQVEATLAWRLRVRGSCRRRLADAATAFARRGMPARCHRRRSNNVWLHYGVVVIYILQVDNKRGELELRSDRRTNT